MKNIISKPFFSFQGKFSSNLDSLLRFFFLRGVQGEENMERRLTNFCTAPISACFAYHLCHSNSIVASLLENNEGKISLTADLVIWVIFESSPQNMSLRAHINGLWLCSVL